MKKQSKVFMNIVKYPDPILRTENKIVYNPSEYFNLAQNMIYTMRKTNGIGIAANQVGKNIQMFIALMNKVPIVMFNPKIIKSSDKIITLMESCLSCPGISVEMTRPYEILIEYVDLRNRVHNRVLEGLNSVVFQHEKMHLDGILIADYIKKEL